MSENVIDSENISKPAPDTAKPKGARKPTKKAKAAKKAGRAKKAAAMPKADRANKKAEVIEMMKRAKGATRNRDPLRHQRLSCPCSGAALPYGEGTLIQHRQIKPLSARA